MQHAPLDLPIALIKYLGRRYFLQTYFRQKSILIHGAVIPPNRFYHLLDVLTAYPIYQAPFQVSMDQNVKYHQCYEYQVPVMFDVIFFPRHQVFRRVVALKILFLYQELQINNHWALLHRWQFLQPTYW